MSVNSEEVRGKQQEHYEIPRKKDWQRPELSILSADHTNEKEPGGPENSTTKLS